MSNQSEVEFEKTSELSYAFGLEMDEQLKSIVGDETPNDLLLMAYFSVGRLAEAMAADDHDLVREYAASAAACVAALADRFGALRG